MQMELALEPPAVPLDAVGDGGARRDMARRHRGRIAHLAGCAAEERVALDYERRGYTIARRRWRSAAGEIDLVVRDGEGLIFVEVKQSASFERAAERVGPRQMRRVCQSAQVFAAQEAAGALTDMRFDVALLDGSGDLRIVENAFGDF